MTSRVMWFRRDLRRRDNPALLEATRADDAVALFVVDPQLWNPSGPSRRAWLSRSLRALDASLGGRLVVVHGDPVTEVARVAREAGAESVHVAADFGPYGRRRDRAVEGALDAAGSALVRTGSPYAIAPGTVRKKDGTPFAVFTPFSRAWAAHGWRDPAPVPRTPHLVTPVESAGVPDDPSEDELGGLQLPEAGEEAAITKWRTFRDHDLADYADRRDRPDLDGTSQLSAHLKYGEVHPRTLLHELAAFEADHPGEGPTNFRSELAWREFYADVLWHRPETAREYLKPEYADLPYATGPEADRLFDAWATGRTGYPIVDAGMRQLRAEGWVHNRMRMVVSSFLVKDLHLEWQLGAREFMHWLRDGDLASNNHGWQWIAGSGTDAAPYFRIFNPVTQGLKFDPAGDYVRTYVPELRGVAGKAVHQPWDLPGGPPDGYPRRIVDHAEERKAALAGYETIRR